MKGFTKGKGEKKQFIPTDSKNKGVSKDKISGSTKSHKLDNSKLLEKKKLNLISKDKAQSLSDGDLKRTLDFVNGTFDSQTKYLEANGNVFDGNFTREQHENTLDTLNMLIEVRQVRKEGGRNMSNLDIC